MQDNRLEELVEEIELLIRYAVPEHEQATAVEVVHSFAKDRFALEVIKDFYRILPEAREEALLKISVVEEKEMVFLLLLSTANHHYLYLTNGEEGMLQGEWKDGMSDDQVLAFFDYPSREAFGKAHPEDQVYREYSPLERMNEDICPSCGKKSGEVHTLGCPVEVCPWCGGQLNHCNCRFEQLEVEELSDEKLLKKLEKKLAEKGRIPYAKDQRPTFMTEGDADQED